MKRSELKEFIKGEIVTSLSEAEETVKDIQDKKAARAELNKELEKTAELSKDLGLEEGEDNWADYTDIGQFYLEGFGKEHTLDDNQLEELGKKIVKQLYKGDIGKAYDEIVKRDLKEANIGLADLEEVGYTDGDKAVAMHFNHDVIGINNDVDFQSYRKGFIQGVNDATIGFSLNEEAGDDDDVDAKAIKAAKGARGKHKKLDLAVKALRDITTEMKSLARDYSKADGVEKEKIKDKLKLKTPKKKELEALVAKLEKNVV